jgi:hypothetical protein
MSGDAFGGIGNLIPDRYDLNARLKPALLALVPTLGLAAVWVPLPRSAEGIIVGLVTTCGVTLLLMHLSRFSGRALEDKWGDAIGRRHSARMLGPCETGLRPARKARIVQLLDAYGPGLPSAADENADPKAASERRLDAIEWMLEVTRADADKSLLLAENISYGFWRNLRGLKPLALLVLVGVLGADGALVRAVPRGDPRLGWSAALAAGCLVGLLFWIFVVTKKRVIQASNGYAERLFAQVDNPSLKSRLAKK